MYLQGRLRHYFVVLFLSVFWGLLHVIVLAGILLYTRKKTFPFPWHAMPPPDTPFAWFADSEWARRDSRPPSSPTSAALSGVAMEPLGERGRTEKRETSLGGVLTQETLPFLAFSLTFSFAAKKAWGGKQKCYGGNPCFIFLAPLLFCKAKYLARSIYHLFTIPTKEKGCDGTTGFKKCRRGRFSVLPQNWFQKGHV